MNLGAHDAPDIALPDTPVATAASGDAIERNRDGRAFVAGVDEPGRTPINGLADSKQLCPERREVLYARIVERALAWHVVFIEVDEIDRVNIFHATMLGMRRALEGVLQAPHHAGNCVARIDGNALPRGRPCAAEAIIGGDGSDRSIMAASILAKVSRDRHMCELHRQWPLYGFAEHKGYSTPGHLAALALHGPCPQHRRTFAPVRAAAQGTLFDLQAFIDTDADLADA